MVKRAQRITYDTIRRMGLELPHVAESTSYGMPALKVKGKMFVCFREEFDSLVLKMPFEQREELMAAQPETYWITDHYREYECVLVRLSQVRADALSDLLRTAHRAATPAKRPRR